MKNWNNPAYRGHQRTNSLNPNHPTYNPSHHPSKSSGYSYMNDNELDYNDEQFDEFEETEKTIIDEKIL